MAKKVIRLTEDEFRKIIYDAVMPYLNEMDGKTYSRIYNASQRAKDDNQHGTYQRSTNGKRVQNNDDVITNARILEPEAKEHWLQRFKDYTFKFYGEDRMGLVADILLKFETVTHLNPERTILVGTIYYNGTQIEGDGIVVNFKNGTVKYKARGNKYQYSLEIDRRTKPQWDALIEQLQMALNART